VLDLAPGGVRVGGVGVGAAPVLEDLGPAPRVGAGVVKAGVPRVGGDDERTSDGVRVAPVQGRRVDGKDVAVEPGDLARVQAVAARRVGVVLLHARAGRRRLCGLGRRRGALLRLGARLGLCNGRSVRRGVGGSGLLGTQAACPTADDAERRSEHEDGHGGRDSVLRCAHGLAPWR